MSNPASSACSQGAQSSIQAPAAPPARAIFLAGLVIVLAGCAAYSNSFNGAFIFDDQSSILQNPTIRHGWWAALSPPAGAYTVSGRPVLNLSLALNYELGGFNVWGYHAFNLIIQLLAGLTLFGLVRRTLERPVLRGRYGASALPLAFIIALLWIVHPLQTESVTYIVQRAEAMMGLFYLLTLYCFVRGVESSRAWVWYALSATACLLGMVTKETMATAPLLILLYDRTFVADLLPRAWRQRWKVYAALAGTGLPLAWMVARISLPDNARVLNLNLEGLSPLMKSYTYALKQCEAVVHYLSLSVWPHPLIFNYGKDVVTNPLDVAPQIVVLALLVGGTFYLLWRRPALGFLGAWFFVILAPTSSVVPLHGQTMAERHLYLSLAAVITFVVLGLYTVLGRRIYIAGLALALGLGGLAFERNPDYHNDISIAASNVKYRPDIAAGNSDYGVKLVQAGQWREALARYALVLRMNPNDAGAENDIGSTLDTSGQSKEAISHFLRATILRPDFAQAFYDLGNAYFKTGQFASAREAFVKVVSLDPRFAVAYNSLGSLDITKFNEPTRAVSEFEAAIQADPTLFEAQLNLANLLTNTNHPADAIPHYEAAIWLNPDFGEAHLGLGNALFLTHHESEAIPQYEKAVQLMPDNATAHGNFASVLMQLKRYDDAAREFDAALSLEPDFPNARANLEFIRQQAAQSTPPSTQPRK